MRKTFLCGIACFTLASIAQAQVQLNIDAGILSNTVGTAAEPIGGLLQLVASPTGNFAPATSSSYVSGDNVLVASFAMNYNSGTTGETLNNLLNLPLSSTTVAYNATNGYTTGVYTLSTGEQIQLRFFTSSTFSINTNYTVTAPILGMTYGAVRSNTVEFGAAGGDSAETPWIVPASGLVDLNYITSNNNGAAAYTPQSAFATNIVGAAVPEPSSLALTLGAAAGVVGWIKRRRS